MKVLITAGPTQEAIDPVRFISNYSSGKMGVAIAEEFANRNCDVILIKGPASVKSNHPSVLEINVTSAQQMFDACKQYFESCDVIVFAAAVADYTPKFPSATKIKKNENEFSVHLIKTKDIAFELGKLKKESQIVVGFALETNDEVENAKEKLKKKNFDFIVLNSMQDAGAGFQHDTNKISIIDNHGNVINFDLKPKIEVAKDIAEFVFKMKSK